MTMTPDADTPRPSLWTALRRGLASRCPACGKGRLFRAYVKVADHCPACGEAFHHHRADDMPAYLVILIVGHLLVPAMIAVEGAFAPPYWLQMAIWLPATFAAAVGLLQPVKGGVVALQWANRMHGFGGEPDTFEPLNAEPGR